MEQPLSAHVQLELTQNLIVVEYQLIIWKIKKVCVQYTIWNLFLETTVLQFKLIKMIFVSLLCVKISNLFVRLCQCCLLKHVSVSPGRPSQWDTCLGIPDDYSNVTTLTASTNDVEKEQINNVLNFGEISVNNCYFMQSKVSI